jgi:hypothetical protein
MIVSSARCGGVIPTLGCEMDVRAAALEGGLRSWLYGGQRGGVGGPSLRSWGWHGAGGGGSWCWRRFSFGNPRSCLGCPTWGQRTGEFSGAVCGCFGTKAQHPAPNDSDACGCRNPLGGVVMGIRSAVRLRVKALDLAVSTATAHCVVFPSWGRRCGAPFRLGLVSMSSWQLWVLRVLFFCFSLICFLRGSPFHLVSVRLLRLYL